MCMYTSVTPGQGIQANLSHLRFVPRFQLPGRRCHMVHDRRRGTRCRRDLLRRRGVLRRRESLRRSGGLRRRRCRWSSASSSEWSVTIAGRHLSVAVATTSSTTTLRWWTSAIRPRRPRRRCGAVWAARSWTRHRTRTMTHRTWVLAMRWHQYIHRHIQRPSTGNPESSQLMTQSRYIRLQIATEVIVHSTVRPWRALRNMLDMQRRILLFITIIYLP